MFAPLCEVVSYYAIYLGIFISIFLFYNLFLNFISVILSDTIKQNFHIFIPSFKVSNFSLLENLHHMYILYKIRLQ